MDVSEKNLFKLNNNTKTIIIIIIIIILINTETSKIMFNIKNITKNSKRKHENVNIILVALTPKKPEASTSRYGSDGCLDHPPAHLWLPWRCIRVVGC